MAVDIKKSLKKFLPVFLEARESGLNEADTVLRLCKFFEEVLGYDGLRDLSREAEFKSKYVDICVKIDDKVRLLIEAKGANVKLRDRHIEQAQGYAAHNNYRWVVLTNGVDWHLYHLTFEEGIEYERAFSISLDDASTLDQAAALIAVLHKQSIKKGELEAFWEKATALGPASIGKALFTDTVMAVVRREIRRDTGLLIDPEDLAKSVHDMLSTEARELVGPLRLRKRRKRTRSTTAAATPPPTAELAVAPPTVVPLPPSTKP